MHAHHASRGHRVAGRLAIAALVGIAVSVAVGPARAEVTAKSATTFSLKHELVLPGSPESIYDAITRDLREWWDHTFSAAPKALYLEPRPGGAFVEIFDDRGDGALHATVIYAERGKKIRFAGPLGLSGFAVELVNTYEFQAVGDSTRLTFTANAAGQMQDEWPAAVDGVWRHFLVERFQPYVASGKHRAKKPWGSPPNAPWSAARGREPAGSR